MTTEVLKASSRESPSAVDEELPLSVIFDSLQMDGEERDRAFVRRVCLWLHERAPMLELSVVAALRLEDVVVTFRMAERVGLVVTGYPPDGLPGAVTLSIPEDEFPSVIVRVCRAPRETPYELCTMDYSLAGRKVDVVMGEYSGHEGELLVAATIGQRQNCRVKLNTGQVITALANHVHVREAL
jgi:hypothetical protein